MPDRNLYVAQALVPTPAFDTPGTSAQCHLVAQLVGRTPWSGWPLGRDAIVPPSAQWGQHRVGCQQADGGVGRGPGVRPTIAVETVPGIQTCATWESVRNAG